MVSKTFAAVSTLVGTVIGAGILGIPFVIMKSGFPIGILHLILLGIIMALVNLYLGEISLRTKQTHQLTGYASKYLGKKGRVLMFLAFAFGVYSALLAYLIGEGESLSFLFFENASYQLYFGIAFWLTMTTAVYFGIKALEEGEFIGISVIAILITGILITFLNKINPANLATINYREAFTPFGVILFAYLGFASIPSIRRVLKKEPEKMKRSIIYTYIACFIIYFVFTIVVVGSQGQNTPQIATLSLGKPFIILGILTLFTSYMALSIALIDTFRFDFKMRKAKAWLWTSILPLAIYITLITLKKTDFIKILGIGGVISGGLTGILILSMIKKAKLHGDRKPEYSIPYPKLLASAIIIIFIIGAIFEVF